MRTWEVFNNSGRLKVARLHDTPSALRKPVRGNICTSVKYFEIGFKLFVPFSPLPLFCSLQGFQGFGFGDGGFQMSFGIGAFPFGIFATAFNINDGRPPPGTVHPIFSEGPITNRFCTNSFVTWTNSLLNDKH